MVVISNIKIINKYFRQMLQLLFGDVVPDVDYKSRGEMYCTLGLIACARPPARASINN